MSLPMPAGAGIAGGENNSNGNVGWESLRTARRQEKACSVPRHGVIPCLWGVLLHAQGCSQEPTLPQRVCDLSKVTL